MRKTAGAVKKKTIFSVPFSMPLFYHLFPAPSPSFLARISVCPFLFVLFLCLLLLLHVFPIFLPFLLPCGHLCIRVAGRREIFLQHAHCMGVVVEGVVWMTDSGDGDRRDSEEMEEVTWKSLSLTCLEAGRTGQEKAEELLFYFLRSCTAVFAHAQTVTVTEQDWDGTGTAALLCAFSVCFDILSIYPTTPHNSPLFIHVRASSCVIVLQCRKMELPPRLISQHSLCHILFPSSVFLCVAIISCHCLLSTMLLPAAATYYRFLLQKELYSPNTLVLLL